MTPYSALRYRESASVLIIEDDDLYCDGLSRHFENLYAYIYHAASFNEAIEVCKEAEFDLNSLDLGLPAFGDDYEATTNRMHVLENVMVASPDARHVVISGRFSHSEAERCKSLGVRGYFFKRYLSAPVLAMLLERMEVEEFVLHDGNAFHPAGGTIAYPFLNPSDEECIKWVERRPMKTKRVDIFNLMARHFNFKNPGIAEQKYKRARRKLLSRSRKASGACGGAGSDSDA